jgi:hypothetical protein
MSCMPNVASVCVVFVLCLVCLMLPVSLGFFVLCLVCLMLPVSLGCLRSMSCMPNVASVSGLSSFYVFVCLMLPVSLGCLRSMSCMPNVACVSGLSILYCSFVYFCQIRIAYTHYSYTRSVQLTTYHWLILMHPSGREQDSHVIKVNFKSSNESNQF